MSLTGLAAHGLPAGFEEGCRSAGGCPNHGTELLVCKEAVVRYRSDFSFKKRVDRGLTAAEILVEERAEFEASRPMVLASKRRDAERAERARLVVVERERVRAERAVARESARQLKQDTVRPSKALVAPAVVLPVEGFDRAVAVWVAACEAKRVEVARCRKDLRLASKKLSAAQDALREAHEAFVVAEVAVVAAEGVVVPRKPYKPRAGSVEVSGVRRAVKPHGTNASFARGCKVAEDCPNFGTQEMTCSEASREYSREYMQKRRADGVAAEFHGTPYGYQLGCRGSAHCLVSPSCTEASLAEERRRRREAGIPAAVETVDAEPVREHVAALMGFGFALVAIAERADVSKSVLKNLVYGRSGDRRGERSASLSVVSAGKILAVRPGGSSEGVL